MSPSTPDDGVQHHAVSGPARAGRPFGAGAVVGAAVGGIVVGVLVSIATGPLPGGSGEVSAEGDLRTACRYVEQLDRVERDDIAVDDPLLWRLDAAVRLALAAEKGGAGDDGLAAAGTEMYSSLQELDMEGLNASLAEMKAHCG